MNRQQRRRDAKVLRKAAKLGRSPSVDVTAAFAAAKTLKLDRKFSAAEALYQKIIVAAPNHWEAHNNLGNLLADRGEFAASAEACQQALAINPDYADGHNNLGTVLRELHDLDGAIAAYRQALELNPDHAGAYFNLGTVLLDLRRADESNAAYRRAAELGHEAARHVLDAATGQVPDTAPRDYVAGLFDGYADQFEHNLVEDLNYRVPSLLTAALVAARCGQSRFSNAVDLGCGSGLVGKELHALTARLTGVDLSAGMLDQAKEKGIYNELVLADIVEHLETTAERFDLFTAADLLVYVGNLEPLFAGIRDASLPGAWFAFSTESTAAADYTLNPTGRYSHSQHYVESLLTQFGYVLQSCDDMTVRTQSGQPVAGNLFVCCR